MKRHIKAIVNSLIPQGTPSPLERVGVRLLLVLCAFFFVACADDNDATPAVTGIEASTLNSLPVQSVVLVEPEEGSNPLLVTFTWSATRFILDNSDVYASAGPVDYALEIAKAGTEFEGEQLLASTSNLRADILVKEINDVLINKLNGQAGEAFDAEFRLIATYGEGLPKTIVSTNTLKMTLTPYKPKEAIQPIFIIGDMNGWDNSNRDFMMFRDDSDDGNTRFTYTGRLHGYFKFCPEESLGTWKMYCNAGNGQMVYENLADGAFNVEDGYWTVVIDTDALTWEITAHDMTDVPTWPQIYLAGAYSGWESVDAGKMTPMEYDPHIWTLDVTLDTVEYGVKFRNLDSWDDRWCPVNPSDVPYGIAAHNPDGQDNNIDLGAETGDYSVKFNDITGHYIVLKK